MKDLKRREATSPVDKVGEGASQPPFRRVRLRTAHDRSEVSLREANENTLFFNAKHARNAFFRLKKADHARKPEHRKLDRQQCWERAA
jgi:hypothetical protein